MAGFSDELKRQLPQVILGIIAGRQGGLPAAGAFQQGMLQRQQQDEARQRQGMLDEERRQAQAAQDARAASAEERARGAEARAADDQKMQKLNSALAYLATYEQGQVETATDPAAAENAMLGRAASLEGMFGVPQGQLSGAIPSMAPAISNRKKRQAKELYTQAEQLYGAEAMANDSVTLQTGELFGDVKPSQLRSIFAVPAVNQTGEQARPMVGNAPAAGSFEDYSTATPERKTQIEADRKAYLQSDDRPRLTVNTTTGNLPTATQRRIDTKTRAFDSLPVVKRTQTMAEAVSFAEGMNPNTKNPADDQALIYAFAKAMDPDSVVREGEYAVVQKYAQSWAESFGFNAARIFSNTAFLTPDARANMKATIRARYASARGQYDNVRRSYVDQINRITQQGDGEDYLTDYGAAFPSTAVPEDAAKTPAVTVQPPVRAGGPGPAPGSNPFRR